ncbi:MurR/RpiR family transcriptional regulator [Cloacibacillus sp. An23]|uniref:MurR/RpiR family transcriptional regulator n=1 Tax=Cloacibacillus sp. An23 TaxID=1965591 RepID=UPI000B3A3664|nr:MurR/RpiR family transcriptional regulator [Cloacibacillus sp. An23]OUO95212.1 hypothetical protein B5F39_01395 [Cloacibacillus sp. An23]
MDNQFGRLRELVASAELPPKLRAAADYVINNLDECRFLTAIELANAINASYSTVIRLAKALGFGGYPEFQKFLRAAFDDSLNTINEDIVVPSQRIDEIIARGVTAPVRDVVAAHVLSNIHNTLANNPEPLFQKASGIILASDQKYIVSERGAACVASFLSLIMRQMVSHVHNYIGYSQNIFDFVSDLGPSDCVIAVSFPRYSLLTVNATEMAKSQGAKIILITDSVTSPLAHCADVVLTAQCRSSDYYNSYVAALMTAEMLCAYLSRISNYSNKELLERINAYTVKFGNF